MYCRICINVDVSSGVQVRNLSRCKRENTKQSKRAMLNHEVVLIALRPDGAGNSQHEVELSRLSSTGSSGKKILSMVRASIGFKSVP